MASTGAAGRVFCVTGGNKGIGLEICRQLAGMFPEARVILGARDVERGRRAAAALQGAGLEVDVQQLEITDAASVARLAEYVAGLGGLDVLVNNAGFAFKAAATEPFAVQAEESVRINYRGTRLVTDALTPHLKPGARVVMVGSRVGLVTKLAPPLRKRFLAPDLTMEQLEALMDQFVAEAKAGTHTASGWPSTAYGMSKIGMAALTRICARDLPETAPHALGATANVCCPGWCRTDMAGDKAPHSAAEGAETPVFLAAVPPDAKDAPSGKFFADKRERDF